MKQIEHMVQGQKYVEIITDETIFNSVDEVLDIMAELYQSGCTKIIVHEKNLNEQFFQLRTGLAGAILQKFATYGFRIAIIGEFQYESKSLNDFIRECNQGSMIHFVPDIASAL